MKIIMKRAIFKSLFFHTKELAGVIEPDMVLS